MMWHTKFFIFRIFIHFSSCFYMLWVFNQVYWLEWILIPGLFVFSFLFISFYFVLWARQLEFVCVRLCSKHTCVCLAAHRPGHVFPDTSTEKDLPDDAWRPEPAAEPPSGLDVWPLTDKLPCGASSLPLPLWPHVSEGGMINLKLYRRHEPHSFCSREIIKYFNCEMCHIHF